MRVCGVCLCEGANGRVLNPAPSFEVHREMEFYLWALFLVPDLVLKKCELQRLRNTYSPQKIIWRKKRYTGIYELEKKTKSKCWAVHRIYAKKVYFLNYTATSLSFSEMSGEKKRGKVVTYKIHHAHAIKQALGQR